MTNLKALAIAGLTFAVASGSAVAQSPTPLRLRCDYGVMDSGGRWVDVFVIDMTRSTVRHAGSRLDQAIRASITQDEIRWQEHRDGGEYRYWINRYTGDSVLWAGGSFGTASRSGQCRVVQERAF